MNKHKDSYLAPLAMIAQRKGRRTVGVRGMFNPAKFIDDMGIYAFEEIDPLRGQCPPWLRDFLEKAIEKYLDGSL